MPTDSTPDPKSTEPSPQEDVDSAPVEPAGSEKTADAEPKSVQDEPDSVSTPKVPSPASPEKAQPKSARKLRRRHYLTLLANLLMQGLSVYVLFAAFSSTEQSQVASFQLYSLLVLWNVVVLSYLLVTFRGVRKRSMREDRGDAGKFLDPWGNTKLGRASRVWAPSVTSAVGLLAGVLVILTVPTGNELTSLLREVQATRQTDVQVLAEHLFPGSELVQAFTEFDSRTLVDIQRTYWNVQKAVGVTTVFLAWALFHVNFAQLYSWMFRHELPGGLEFSSTETPNDVDFMYYSFTIGTTFAVSDVVTTSTEMRWRSIQHGVASFFYNAIVLAIAIKLITS